jgi:hypothetical protein
MNEVEIARALNVTAYTFVMLSATANRALKMAERWADMKGPVGHGHRINFDQNMLTTSSTEAHYFLRQEPKSLLEYRAYVELTLILARNLSDVVCPPNEPRGDDIVAWHLVGVDGYTLPGLGEPLRTRINKGSSLHLVRFEDSRQWGISEIRDWAATTLVQLKADMTAEKPERAEIFQRAIAKYRAEMEPSA